MFHKMLAGVSVAILMSACPSSDSDLARAVGERLDRAAQDGFSGAVLIRSRGRVLAETAYGFADRSAKRGNTTGTAFDVGSILKVFTALAIFQLEKSDKLAVGDSLGELLPDVPADKTAITLRDILLHRAGFDEYHDTQGDFEALTREQARARILAQRLRFEPGTDEAYSNSGYTLLADIIETYSETPYMDYVRRAVFVPAGMTETGFYSQSVWDRVPTAIGYGAEHFESNDPAHWPYTWALVGNGGLVTTVRDLDRFGSALWEARILDRDALEVFQREYLASGGMRLHGEDVYGTAGAGDYGLGGVLVEVPSREFRLVLVTNTYDTFDIEALAEELLEQLLTRAE